MDEDDELFAGPSVHSLHSKGSHGFRRSIADRKDDDGNLSDEDEELHMITRDNQDNDAGLELDEDDEEDLMLQELEKIDGMKESLLPYMKHNPKEEYRTEEEGYDDGEEEDEDEDELHIIPNNSKHRYQGQGESYEEDDDEYEDYNDPNSPQTKAFLPSQSRNQPNNNNNSSKTKMKTKPNYNQALSSPQEEKDGEKMSINSTNTKHRYYQDEVCKPVYHAGKFAFSIAQAKLYGLVDKEGNIKALQNNENAKTEKRQVQYTQTLAQPRTILPPFTPSEETQECRFQPQRSTAALRAMKNKKCGYDFMDRLQTQGDFLTRLQQQENAAANNKHSKISKSQYEAMKNDYDIQLDKLQCPQCLKPQSFDEYYEKRRICTQCHVKFTKLHITTGQGFVKAMQEKEQAKVMKLQQLEQAVYGTVLEKKKNTNTSSGIPVSKKNNNDTGKGLLLPVRKDGNITGNTTNTNTKAVTGSHRPVSGNSNTITMTHTATSSRPKSAPFTGKAQTVTITTGPHFTGNVPTGDATLPRPVTGNRATRNTGNTTGNNTGIQGRGNTGSSKAVESLATGTQHQQRHQEEALRHLQQYANVTFTIGNNNTANNTGKQKQQDSNSNPALVKKMERMLQI